MINVAELRHRLVDMEVSAIVIGKDASEHSEAILGVCNRTGAIVYSYSKLVESFEQQGMDQAGAVEWIEYNVVRGLDYQKGLLPIIVDDWNL